MKTIGFVDYYLNEWHANNYPNWIREICEKEGLDFVVKYAWAEKEFSTDNSMSTDEWCKKFGVEKCDTIEELCEKSDYILILAPSNPEKHLGYAEQVLKYKKNTYIDKTFAPDYETARKIFDVAERYGTKFFSTSALRYATELEELLESKSIITMGGGRSLEEYIIHQIEMVIKVLDAEFIKVRVNKQGDNQYVCAVEFNNDKSATMLFSPIYPFTVCVDNKQGNAKYEVIKSDFFKNLIADILNFYRTGEVSFDTKQTLEVMKIREAVVSGVNNKGKWIYLKR